VTTTSAPRELLERIRDFIGAGADRPGKTSRVFVNEPFIQQFTDLVGDRNPVYSDAEFAASSVHGGIVAPPVALSIWRLRGLDPTPGATWIDETGTRRFRQDPNGVRVRGEDSRTVRDELNDVFADFGYSSPLATNERVEYRRYLRPGDRLTFGSPVINTIDGPKQTRLGEGFFVTHGHRVTDQNGETVAVVEQTYLRFKPAARDTPARTAFQPKLTPVLAAPDRAADAVPDPRTTLAFSDVKSDQELPGLVIELTPTLIAGGALATQDFQDVHHDRDLVQRRGHPDVFMNILTTSGLIGRYVTDWAGPEALIRTFEIRLGRPNYPYDEMTMSGVVTALQPKATGGEVLVQVHGHNSLGEHVRSTVGIELPERGGRP
jgi:acyl dehydratase